jgi:hypothetical protein
MATIDRPTVLAPKPQNFPKALAALPQWIVWRHDLNKETGEWDKVLYDPRTGRKARSNDPSTWTTLAASLARYNRGDHDGPGFVFQKGGGFVGIDLDGCRDLLTGALTDWATEVVETLDSYSEVSPSGTGVKIFVRGKSPFTTGKKIEPPNAPQICEKLPQIEVYDFGRYFTTTGHRLDGPTEPQERQAALDWLKEKFCPAPVRTRSTTTAVAASVVERARKYLATMNASVSGQRGHDTAFAAACALVLGFGLDQETALQLLMGEWNERCQPPWSEHELRHKVRSADQQEGERNYLRDAKRERFNATGAAHQPSHNGNGRAHGLADRPADSIAATSRKSGQGHLPKIDAGCHDLPKVTAEAWSAVRLANAPPFLFRYSGLPTRLEHDDRAELVPRPLDEDRMRHVLARVADWTKQKKIGEELAEVPAMPPRDVVRDVLATPDVALPVVTRFVPAPVFAKDGSLQIEPGYHAASKTYYEPAAGFTMPSVPERPTQDDVARARALLLDELLVDFPFVGPAEKAHALAALLLPFARDLIEGPTPLHLIEKPTPGTGATLMVDMLAYPMTGRPIPAMTEGRDEDEWRKRVTAKLLSASLFLLIDNLRRRLDSAAVASAITSPTWEDRVLRLSEMAKIPVRCVWLATGNNPAVSSEIARRTVRIRLDARQDRPWLRTAFRHANLRVWAAEHRGELVWAALTLIRAWIAAGQPAGPYTLGMFESWASTIGGILDVAGVEGFLSNLEDFYEDTDAEGATWRAFVGAWYDRHGSQEVTVAELWTLLRDDQIALPIGDGNEQSQRVRMGKLLSDARERVYEIDTDASAIRLQIARGGKFRRAVLWKLVKMGGSESIPDGECVSE